jgi:magnesium transporter
MPAERIIDEIFPPLILPEVRSLLADADAAGIAEVLEALHPASLAAVAEELDDAELLRLMDQASVEQQATVIAFLSPEKQQALAREFGPERLARVLAAMSHDDRVHLLRKLTPALVENLLPLVDKADREDIRRLLRYPADSAGAVMTTDYATLAPDLSVVQALAEVRRQAPQRETIYYNYVVDAHRHLIGVVSLRDLILAAPDVLISDLMGEEVVSVRADEDQEEVAAKLTEYDLLAVPVVDEQHRLVGIVTHDDVADVVAEEVTEDFHLGAAVAPLAADYRHSGVWALYQRRVGWLVILVFVNLVSSGVISAFEETLQATIALAFFLPLLIDSGGNTGSQAATLVVRALATDEVRMREWFSVLAKEVSVGLALGATMAVASFLLGMFRGGIEIGLVVGISMLLIVVLTNLIGVLLPFALTKLKFDPAVASSPLITTVADATGLALYFSVARLILPAFA